MRKNLIFPLLMLFSASACDSAQDELSGSVLIFGHFYGFCQGSSCNLVYQLTDTALFEAVDPPYPGVEKIAYDFRERDLQDYEATKDLLDQIPEELIEEPDGIIGCPDCADQGGILIELEVDGELRRWRIDQSKAALPKYLHDFVDLVNQKISLLTP